MQRTLNDVDTDDDRITFSEHSDDLQPTQPNSLWCSIFSLRLSNLLVVLGPALLTQQVDGLIKPAAGIDNIA